MNAQLKDHYRTLELKPAATLQEVKAAYRRLARLYHPDVNTGAYSEIRFLDIKEAYDTLSDANQRRRYDEERWLMGMGNRTRDVQAITPKWILDESRKLARHMQTIDTYRMSHSALYDYIQLLLADAHMAILQQEGSEETNQLVVTELLNATRHLKHEYMVAVATRLAQLVAGNNDILQSIYRQVQQSNRRAGWDRYFPLIITLIALLLCAVMYLWVKQ
ncbi:MAG: J domain-containing protein [Sphingobacteriales bacterium]|nr:MAG: J domain-containing protein [Sphingobacteriales bacterium]